MLRFEDLILARGAFLTRGTTVTAISDNGTIAGAGRKPGAGARAMLARPLRTDAVIDIVPEDANNELTPYASTETVRVAVLTTRQLAGASRDFDATTVVGTTVRLGRNAAAPLSSQPEVMDVDGDGNADVVFEFRTGETGLECFDTQLTLYFGTNSNDLYAATDSVQTGAACGGTWQSTLLPRDVDDDGIVDAYYDTELDITWLADAGLRDYPGNPPFTPPNWPGAQTRMDQLNAANYLGASNWRLPVAEPLNGNAECAFEFGATGCGELAHLFYETLGNRGFSDADGNPDQPGRGLLNTGPFRNLGPLVDIDEVTGRRTCDPGSASVPGFWYGTPANAFNAFAFDFCTGSTNPKFIESSGRIWAVRDGDLGGTPTDGLKPEAVYCPGDLNGDALAEVVMLTSDGEVIVRDTEGNLVSQFTYPGGSAAADAVLVPDLNNNGAPELAALFGESGSTEVRDLRSGNRLYTINFTPGLDYIDLELMKARAGEPGPTLAAMSRSPAIVQVRDALTRSSTLDLAPLNEPVDLEVYPGTINQFTPVLGVLFRIGREANADLLQTYASLKSRPNNTRLDMRLQVQSQAQVADLTGDDYPETVILGKAHDEDLEQVTVVDSMTGATLGDIRLNPAFDPVKLLAIADINGNGADEVVVFATEANGDRKHALIKDSKSRRFVNVVYFDPNYSLVDAASCPDMNGNGAPELVLLGKRDDNGKVRAIVKDAKTDALIGRINF